MNDLLEVESDIGVLIDALSSHRDLWCTADGYCVGVMCKSASQSVGWSEIHVPQLFATKFGVVLGMNGTRWVNDNTLHMSVITPRAYTSLNEISNDRSIYGVVFTGFGSATGPSHNQVKGLSVEFAQSTGYRQVVQAMFYRGQENTVVCRNDAPSNWLPMYCARHLLPADNPTLNRVLTARSEHYESNGYANYLLTAPYTDNPSVQIAVTNLEDIASFSGSDRVYFMGVSAWKADVGAPTAFAPYFSPTETFGIKYRPREHAFHVTNTNALALVIRIPDNSKGDVYLQIDRHLSQIVDSHVSRADFLVLDTEGIELDISTWPLTPVRRHPALALFPQGSPNWLRPGANTTDPIIVGFDSWVRQVVVRFWADCLQGFRLQLLNTALASVYSPAQFGSSLITERCVAQVPERGAFRTPTIYRYTAEQTGGNFTRLSLPDVPTELVYVAKSSWIPGQSVNRGEWWYEGSSIYEAQTSGTTTGTSITNDSGVTWELIKSDAVVLTSANWLDF